MSASDFNDLHAQAGAEVVRLQVAQARPVDKKPRRRAPGSTTVSTRDGAIALSEDALALRFEAENKGFLAYAHKLGAWFIYDEATGMWQRDQMERVAHFIREHVRGLNTQQQEKWLRARVVSAVEQLARRAPDLAITGDDFDANPWCLGTPAGVLDLRDGQLLPHDPGHYVSKRVSVAPTLDKPALWLQFLEDATGSDAQLMDYLQRLAGYCLTGETREEALVFMHGPGGNGKGVFMNALREIMADYARQAPMQVFLASASDRHPTELANLFGARLVLASESPEGRRWDEEKVKSLTGRDAIAARFMGRDFFEFVPRFKLLVASNHKPRIRTVDDAWRRRLHLVPFTRKPANPDPGLKDKLRAEYPAILNWMIEGAEWWSREGLCPPEIVKAATEEYFREEDVIGLWFEECCEVMPSARAERKDLYASYEAWCRGMGHAAATLHAVTRWFKQRGHEQDASKATRPILGVGLIKGELL